MEHTKKIVKKTFFFVLIVISGLCHSCKNDSDLSLALKIAGDNRPELEKVLKHYRNDSLKYKAAVFLIENMPGHYTRSDTAYMNAYYAAIDSVMLLCKNESDKMRDSLFHQTVARFTNLQQKLIGDIHIIKSGYLIDHIDRAFFSLQMGDWAQHINFDDFCEYLLPYKVCEAQDLDDWREYLIHYGDTATLTRLSYCGLYKNAAYMACRTINNSLQDHVRKRWGGDRTNYIPVRKMSSLLKIPSGICDDYCYMELALMRAHGIPVIMDYTPQWSSRALGHSWLVLIGTSGTKVVFESLGPDPLCSYKEAPMAKVFRKTYARNKEIVKIHRSEKYIPPKFATPFMKDVTEEYQATVDLTFPVKDSRNHTYAYLSVFNNASWVPVHWGKLKNKKVRFDKMGRRTAYLPVFYEGSGIRAFSDPVVVLLSGEVKTLKADTSVRQHLTLLRKHPPLERVYNVAHLVMGGKIQIASDSLFTDSVTLHTIEEFGVVAREINLGGRADSARYWRYLSPDSSYCNMAELFFYEKDSVTPIMGEIIGTSGSKTNDDRFTKAAVFDRDALTFFNAPQESHCWVGLDFGRPVCIDRIIYYPRSDGNNIEIGHEYELFYWEDGQWQSLGRKKADSARLEYERCPGGNALFLLHDYTKGNEERIFTYENGEQVWL